MMHRLGWTLLLGLVGCAGQTSTIHPEAAQLGRFVGEFCDAVQNDDADALYDMMGEDVRESYTLDEFREDFRRHKPLYAEYGDRLGDALQAGEYDIRARYEGAPCSRGELAPCDESWCWTQLPDEQTFDDEESQKERLVSLIQTRRFIFALSAYAEAHPEWSASDQRSLRRALGFEKLSPEDVTFDGNRARIQIADVAQIEMVCTSNGWRVDKCISYRSTK